MFSMGITTSPQILAKSAHSEYKGLAFNTSVLLFEPRIHFLW